MTSDEQLVRARGGPVLARPPNDLPFHAPGVRCPRGMERSGRKSGRLAETRPPPGQCEDVQTVYDIS